LIVYSLELNLILHVYTDKGSTHDFKMFKQSNIWTMPHIQSSKNQLLDLGFLGCKKYLPNSTLPNKNSKLKKLTKKQKKENTQLSKKRIRIENINRECKIFRIVKSIRRQKQTKHNLFWNLIAGLVNFKHLN
jgi:hypothetical protein